MLPNIVVAKHLWVLSFWNVRGLTAYELQWGIHSGFKEKNVNVLIIFVLNTKFNNFFVFEDAKQYFGYIELHKLY